MVVEVLFAGLYATAAVAAADDDDDGGGRYVDCSMVVVGDREAAHQGNSTRFNNNVRSSVNV